jgi:hypothetical protein
MAVVLKIIDFANGAPCPIAGWYLQDFDFDAFDGQGHGNFTDDIHAALKFDDVEDAMEYWRTVSMAKPVRSDGQLNRPLTASNVVIEGV